MMQDQERVICWTGKIGLPASRPQMLLAVVLVLCIVTLCMLNIELQDVKQRQAHMLHLMNKRMQTLAPKTRTLESKIQPNKTKLDLKPVVTKFECTIPSFEGYPACTSKIKWMEKRWRAESCYADWGVDGSQCSIVRYLSEIERWCPPVVYHNYSDSDFLRNKHVSHNISIQDDFEPLYKKFKHGIYFKWIQQRIELMKKKWVNASKALTEEPYYNKTFHKKRILLHLSLLADDNNHWKIADMAFKGGPLGELVQWSDIIASLYVLGHEITLTVSTVDLRQELQSFFNSMTSFNCPVRNRPFDLIYTDIRGMKILRSLSASKLHLIKCMLRVVDSFGTEPAYNNVRYAIRRKLAGTWGRWELNTKQFYTMFPHTPDNSFIGFVIDKMDESEITKVVVKQHLAVVYGKDENFWKGKKDYLNAIQDLIPLHATVNIVNASKIPDYIVNHGVLAANKYHDLLRSAKIFVGLGFPYEGPAPLEAMASGAVFLNPVFENSSPMEQDAKTFFRTKPTSRRLTSQNSYAQDFVGPPLSRTVHLDNVEEVRHVVNEILSEPRVAGYIPYEFTALGMLERIFFFVENQEFCFKSEPWPPLTALQIVAANGSLTCIDACLNKGLICEREFFPQINKRSTFITLDVKCDTIETPVGQFEEIDYPSYDGNRCYLQGNHELFSCTGRYTNTVRVCPCRDAVKGQVALCKDCYVTS